MRALTLEYHDIVDTGSPEASGFQGPGPALYKLEGARFRDHLLALSSVLKSAPVRVNDAHLSTGEPCVMLTFDDGGEGALRAADLLEACGWRGHFFVTTDYLDTAGFLTGAQVRELHHRGHVIGSHSCSHPAQMSHCSRDQLLDEWGRSTDRLSSILGTVVITASVPGGFYHNRVAQAASDCGIRCLFNSEPVTTAMRVGDCMVYGRFTITRATTAREAAALLSRWPLQRWRQYVHWSSKKIGKTLLGHRYPAVRRYLLTRRGSG